MWGPGSLQRLGMVRCRHRRTAPEQRARRVARHDHELWHRLGDDGARADNGPATDVLRDHGVDADPGVVAGSLNGRESRANRSVRNLLGIADVENNHPGIFPHEGKDEEGDVVDHTQEVYENVKPDHVPEWDR
jgi:hypothetical protein